MTTIINGNAPYSASQVMLEIPDVLRSASDLYTAYAARVTTDGGTVTDPTACLAAITAALAGNYWQRAAIAISARWGVKTVSGSIAKFYNLVDSTGATDGYVLGSLTFDTTTETWATYLWDSSDVITFYGVNVIKAGRIGYCGASKRATLTNGTGLQFTPSGGQNWQFRDYSGAVLVNFVTIVTASIEFTTPNHTATGLYVDQERGEAALFQDGTHRKTYTNTFTALSDGTTADVTISRNGTTTTQKDEDWLFNDATFASVKQASTDLGARY